MLRRLLPGLLLGLMLLPSPGYGQGVSKVRQLLGQGWTYLEAGNLRKAEEAFTFAFEDPVGRNAAEVYYAIAAVWWERRNAMAAYMWLSDAGKARKDSYTWDGGPGGEWDQRIDARKRYVEANFTVIKLRAPKRGRPLPPLADPVPADPLLREFTDRLPVVVNEGVEAKMAVHWVLLPNGGYWIGGELVQLSGGELDPTKAASWELPADRGKARAAYAERLAALTEGRSMAGEAAEAAAAEEQRNLDAAAAAEAQAARDAEARRLAEAQEAQEQERRAAEEAELAAAERLAEEERLAELERQRVEVERRDEERRVEAERREAELRGEADRRADERRAADELQAEEKRLADERRAEEKRLADERRAEEKRLADERRAEEKRLAQEQRDADSERRAEDRRLAEDRRAEEDRAEEERRAAARAERDEQDRLAEERRRADEEAEEEARLAEARRRQEERAAEEAEERRRDDQRWEQAARDTEQAEERRQAADGEARAQATASTAGAADALMARRFYIAGGGGLTTVDRLEAEGSSVEADWAAHGELGVALPLTKGKVPVALAVGLSYGSLPLAGCSFAQTRSHALALHVAPRLAVPLGGRAFLAARVGIHVGAAGAWPSDRERQSCAEQRSDQSVAYGARLESGAASADLSYGDLGWSGYGLVVGPDFEIGLLGAPGPSPVHLGIAFFLRHDQVFAAIDGGRYHLRADDGVELETVELSSLDPSASMPRFQLGARGTVLF